MVEPIRVHETWTTTMSVEEAKASLERTLEDLGGLLSGDGNSIRATFGSAITYRLFGPLTKRGRAALPIAVEVTVGPTNGRSATQLRAVASSDEGPLLGRFAEGYREYDRRLAQLTRSLRSATVA